MGLCCDLYGVHDLCSDIDIQSSFTGCPITSHSSCISALQYIPYPQIARSEASSLWISLQRLWPPKSVVTQAHLYWSDFIEGFNTANRLSGSNSKTVAIMEASRLISNCTFIVYRMLKHTFFVRWWNLHRWIFNCRCIYFHWIQLSCMISIAKVWWRHEFCRAIFAHRQSLGGGDAMNPTVAL